MYFDRYSTLRSVNFRNKWAGETDEGRLQKSKYDSFKAALYSYQGQTILFHDKKYKCLINKDKLKVDYDQKEISIDFQSGIRVGSVFEWLPAHTHWIVWLQELNETSYFRGEIRRCACEIQISDTEKVWAYRRGPDETTTQWRHKHKLSFNDMNLSCLLCVEKNEKTNAFFTRHRIIKMKDDITGEENRWIVEAVDRYRPDILEVYIEEYSNETTPQPTKPNPNSDNHSYILGEDILYPYDTDKKYTTTLTGGSWELSCSPNIAAIVGQSEQECVININTGRSASFIVNYKKEDSILSSLNIRIDSL